MVGQQRQKQQSSVAASYWNLFNSSRLTLAKPLSKLPILKNVAGFFNSPSTSHGSIQKIGHSTMDFFGSEANQVLASRL